MIQSSRQPKMTGWQRDLVLFLDRQIYRLSKHWLVVFNVVIGAYVLLPVLAPVLMEVGAPGVGRLIYAAYRPACHQLPERSFFVFGQRVVYALDELWALGLVPRSGNVLQDQIARQRFLGTPDIGYKLGLCQRDIGLYGGLFVAGLIYGLLRRRLRPLKIWVFGLCLLPMAIDGGTQLLMLRESNWFLRLITGGLTGGSAVWFLYPHLELAFADIRRQANERVHME